MADTFAAEIFTRIPSESYDENCRKLGAIYDNLHFLIRLILKDLPADARILCVGVGTGTEILELAQSFPNWRFKGVDPSASMLKGCHDRLEKRGLLDRCELFHGYLSELPETEGFDAVLCLLVPHFIKDRSERLELFRSMARRLKPQGYLINAEVSADMSSPEFPDMFEKWKAVLKFGGADDAKLANVLDLMKEHLLVLPPAATESILRESGFDEPIQFFQSLLIRAWYSKR